MLLSLVLIGLGLANVWRFFGFNAERGLLTDYGATISPVFLMILAALWAIIFVGLSILVFRGRDFGRTATPIALAIYALIYLVLPTPTVPTLYWHIALILFSLFALFTGRSTVSEIGAIDILDDQLGETQY